MDDGCRCPRIGGKHDFVCPAYRFDVYGEPATPVCNCGKPAEDECVRCESPLCVEHCYGRGEGDNIDEETYCAACVNDYDDWEV